MREVIARIVDPMGQREPIEVFLEGPLVGITFAYNDWEQDFLMNPASAFLLGQAALHAAFLRVWKDSYTPSDIRSLIEEAFGNDGGGGALSLEEEAGEEQEEQSSEEKRNYEVVASISLSSGGEVHLGTLQGHPSLKVFLVASGEEGEVTLLLTRNEALEIGQTLQELGEQ